MSAVSSEAGGCSSKTGINRILDKNTARNNARAKSTGARVNELLAEARPSSALSESKGTAHLT